MKKTERHKNDFYITPNTAIDVLLNNYELKPGWILEPCAGSGAIVKAIYKCSNWDGDIYAVEIRPEENDNLVEAGCKEVLIKDFLDLNLSDFKCAPPCPPRTIITNPPFSIAQEIVKKSFEISSYPNTDIIMFLRLGFLESKDRAEFWLSHKNVSLITLKKRPSFTGKGTDFAAYAWFIWNGEQQFIIPCA